MLIVGAKGFAKEVLEVLYQLNDIENLVFFDDISSDLPEKLFDKFTIIKSKEKAKKYFEKIDNRFTLGLGNPMLRKKMSDSFELIGGILSSTISPKAEVGNFGNSVLAGCNIMTGTIITNDIRIGKGVLINLNSTVGHDCIIEDYVEISPSVSVSGNCRIGAFSNIGTNAVVLPKVNIGENVTIGAGAVVTKDLPDNCIAVGIPAKIINQLDPLSL